MNRISTQHIYDEHSQCLLNVNAITYFSGRPFGRVADIPRTTMNTHFNAQAAEARWIREGESHCTQSLRNAHSLPNYSINN